MRAIGSLCLSLAISLALLTGTEARNADSIDKCPPLKVRRNGPKDVTDVRIDDIKVIAALGDSIIGGFGLMGKGNGTTTINTVIEYRGESYPIGGNDGAETLATYTKRYQPKLKGASVGEHLVERCNLEYCPPTEYRPSIDNLNGARSGAVAKSLDPELDYVIPRMKNYPGVDFENDWKLITIQIGSNDQCGSCTSFANESTVEAYTLYVESAIERIQNNIPKIIVNLIGNLRVSALLPLAEAHAEYCPSTDTSVNYFTPKAECPCLASQDQTDTMDYLADNYDKALINIAHKYRARKGGDFAVVYQPYDINFISFPVQALSSLDCFHPSLTLHKYFSKIFWNSLFLPSQRKPQHYSYDPNLTLYCPKQKDRIATK
ncbi:hypothetical protein J3Q64DRAFT_1727054 [Phycomyces blakesleeanus]|uniref:SGNH hydrolase-type esterase domain-containing protein n=2 Tax=Phycomyces blakesleeanus TaxID=4837 RepID=A0A162YJ56_PHYB8|nr:hypothetical protein PHYBLDRAFT_138610 [Phycomyces blakesleeanus NRRL 1555(-)]OAD81065.1 hypothetical protein PHYBLDRAFT_138610 [Phycomyces blakesleeanus NRRL 1555(-)]|eukprot:XP_018299105.1 hypothetical protein PHYBLDRAFT_138610 [Phycomyces blakesleeanus NRRL 1555(-)]